MYDMSTVLSYDNRKIWIKKIDDNMFLINGCLLVSRDVETFSVEDIAHVLDACYEPFMYDFDDKTQFVVRTKLESTGRYILSPYYIEDNKDVIDLDSLRRAREEFNDWSNDLENKSVIYINDYRTMSFSEYARKVEC